MKPVIYAFLGTGVLFAAIILGFFLLRSPQERREAETGTSVPSIEEARTKAPPGAFSTTAKPTRHTAGHSERVVEERRLARKRPRDAHADAEEVETPLPLPERNAEVTFELRDPNGDAVESATVTLLGGREDEEALSDRQGNASFEDIEAGTYSFTVRMEGIPDLTCANAFTVNPEEHRLIPLSIGTYDLSISGRVLDRAGSPLEGIAVFAHKQLFGGREEELLRADSENLRVKSGSDGTYTLSGLDATDYLLNTGATKDFPPVRKIYRAGVTSADLILDEGLELEIYGTVTSEDGVLLKDVQVRPVGQADRQRITDSAGEYVVQLSLRQGQTAHSLVARKDGFREERLHVRVAEIGDAEEWQMDIVLKPLGTQVPVVGQVFDPEGHPVGSQTIHLRSAVNSAKYQATSDPDGHFSIEDVQVGGDYRLWLYPRDGYKDYSRVPVAIAEPGSEIEIVLEDLETGTVSGTMIDNLGKPVPRFALWLRSMKALGNSISVTGDDAGGFAVEDVPEGELHFETRSLPRLTVRGIRLTANESKEVHLVLDWGDLSFQGTVLDKAGKPIAGASVLLNWKHNKKGVQSSSFRNTVTDAAGRFTFSGLGAGDHTISVTTKSHGRAKEQYEVGGSGPDPVIRLEAR